MIYADGKRFLNQIPRVNGSPLAKWQSKTGGLYFFLYPAGHLGLTAVTFLVTLPLMQVMVVFLS